MGGESAFSSQRGADTYRDVPASRPWLVSSHADELSESSQFYWSKKLCRNWSEWTSSDCSVEILIGLGFDRKKSVFWLKYNSRNCFIGVDSNSRNSAGRLAVEGRLFLEMWTV